MGEIERKESKVFFIDGTGKTYLYRAILATVRKNGGIALATTTSGITATMLPDGRTTHSRFQLPMTPASTSMCRTNKQTEQAKLLRHATVLMWDKATMAHRYSLEVFNWMMRDITGVAEPFGGKILIMGGDFRRVLPVIRRSTRGQTVDACLSMRIIQNDIELHCILSRPHLWENVNVLHLKKNMRAAEDVSYSEFFIRAGNGDEPCVANEMIKVPEEMVIPWVSDASLSQLIDVTFPNLVENARDRDYMVNRVLITPLNEELVDNREGVYTFHVQDDIYHRIGSLLPPVVENETDPPSTGRPIYIQMYINDTDNQINWRMKEGGEDLNREVMEKLRIILDTHNRFVHVIRPLAQREDIQRCKLVIKEQPKTEN
ncbi:ATP-dependent DNA helicase PIF1-like [Papaver somniferum]|uniref:ATP-dependent DNA helicase PIF1-like n=1 Tax=Papaver somniferum TaxID=3469 RepID=UPI000E701E06|nr:ATP-dependent DNA helicase PIF1-like [Papaver somniferum]